MKQDICYILQSPAYLLREERLVEKRNVLISIIVPTYNVEQYAKHCIDSLIAQTISDIEIILVDDGSTDSSGVICDDYAAKDQRIRVIHQKNSGLGISRNSGLKIASGKYVGFVDSDDYISKDMYKILYEAAEKYRSEITYCNYKKTDSDNEDAKEQNCIISPRIWEGEESIRQYLLDRIGLPPTEKADNLFGASVCCGLFLKEFLDKQNAFFVSERTFIAEDMIFDIDTVPFCNKIVHLDLELYYYRYNPASLTTTYKPERFFKNVDLYHEMYRRLQKIYSKEDSFNSLSRYLITTARIAVMQEVRFLKRNGIKRTIDNIKSISTQKDLTDILKEYKWQLLPVKYRIMCFCQKHHLYLFQILMCKAQNAKRKA